jgi:hypothetical protein
VKRGDIPGHIDEVWALLTRCEEKLPQNCMTTALHSLCHLWSTIQYVGPAYVSWTLPLERFMKEMRRNIHSTGYPAQNFVNRFQTRQRLLFLPKKVIREMTELTSHSDYEFSNTLRLVFTSRARKGKGWSHVREFVRITSGLERLATQCQLPELFTHLQKYPAFAATVGQVTRSIKQVACNLDRVGRERHVVARLLQEIPITFGRSLQYKDRYYSSAYAERAKTTRSSFVWVHGRTVKATWDGYWHGRILYFVRAEHQGETTYLAAIRFFDKRRTFAGEHGSTIIQTDPDLADLGLFRTIYFVDVERIGGRECLCATNEANPNMQLVTYIDYLPSED